MQIISTLLLTATVASGTSVSRSGLRGLQQTATPNAGYCTGDGLAREGSAEHLSDIIMDSKSIFIRNAVSDRYIAADQTFVPTQFNADNIAAIPLDLEDKLDSFSSSSARWSLSEVTCPSASTCPSDTTPCYIIESRNFNGDLWRLSAQDTELDPNADFITGTEPRLINPSDTSILDQEKWQIVPRSCAGDAAVSPSPCYHIDNAANGRRWYRQPNQVTGTFGAVYWDTQLYTDQLWELIPTDTFTRSPTAAPTSNPCIFFTNGEQFLYCAIRDTCYQPSSFAANCVP